MTFRCAALIPSRNHARALPTVVEAVIAQGLPVFIIDDGSDSPTAEAIAALHAPERGIVVHRLPENQGKGAAVCVGFRLAQAAGFTHALQIDADGQHDREALPRLLALAKRYPEAVVSGAPLYDGTVPTARKVGRWLTHVWVFVETLSFRITDSMCGFRVYPLAACRELLAEESVGARMDFDTEILVRLFWRGVPPLMLPVRVTYPPGNTSNFDVWRDNVRITRMHTRLVFGMLRRLPQLLRHRPPHLEPSTHWAGLAERGAVWGLRLVAGVSRGLGRRAGMALLIPVVAYFYLTGRRQRAASRQFLGRVLRHPPSWRDTARHTLDFAQRALETVAAWDGSLPTEALIVPNSEMLSDPRGAVLVVSHHGNVDLARALMAPALRDRLTVLTHTRHAENYNRVLREFAPHAALRLVHVTEIGPETIIALQERIERGEWVAIAGDRIPVLSQGRVVSVPFLGERAEFAQGPWLLASLLGCPVRLLFCRRETPQRWRLSLEPFAERILLPRGQREAAITELATRYAQRLEVECHAAPSQWYNFFDFWATGER